MPSRLIREGILTSDRVDLLDAEAELFYRRLLSKVDDFGLYDARLSILRATLYPLRLDRVGEADCCRWLTECVEAGLIELYEVAGKTYLHVLRTGWTARSEPKFPRPETGKPAPVDTSVNSCAQLKTSVPVVVDVDVDKYGDGGGDDKRARRPAAALPDWLPAHEWDEWRKHRGRKLTAQAQAAQLRKLAELRQHGHDPGAVIRLAIESGWATFYPPRSNGSHKADKRAATAAAMHGTVTGALNVEPTDITAESRRVA